MTYDGIALRLAVIIVVLFIVYRLFLGATLRYCWRKIKSLVYFVRFYRVFDRNYVLNLNVELQKAYARVTELELWIDQHNIGAKPQGNGHKQRVLPMYESSNVRYHKLPYPTPDGMYWQVWRMSDWLAYQSGKEYVKRGKHDIWVTELKEGDKPLNKLPFRWEREN